MERAPFFADVADGPETSQAYWATAADGVRIRVGIMGEGQDGTVLLFPGRTEYIEKYGPTARDFETRGYTTLAVDWRGQGLADRRVTNPVVGHIEKFTDFQQDVAAAIAMAHELDLPRPWMLLGHSMGGAIGLRAVLEGLDVRAVAFSAPMWGIRIRPILRPIAWILSGSSNVIGMSERITPFTFPESYVLRAPFKDNMLTTDPEMYAFMQKQLRTYPELGLGGPSLAWLYQSMQEIRWLRTQKAPNLPCITFLGGNERIVDSGPIHARMATWPGGRVEMVEGAEHELLMEGPDTRSHVFDMMDALFRDATGDAPAAQAG